jgi:hypothetical protein
MLTKEEPQSPFLPNTHIQYAWDSTSLSWAKTCPRLYYYSMVCGYRPKGESVHLRFGIEYHLALQQYDLMKATGADHDDALHRTIQELVPRLIDYVDPDDDARPSEKAKTKANLVRTVVWYLERFQDDPAQTWIKRDGTPAVEQSFRFELDDTTFLCGHLDRIVSYQGDLYVMDRKTTYSTPGSYYFDRYEPDNQMSLYTLAGQVILKTPVRGVIIDVAQVAVGFSRFVRGLTYRTKDQLDEWRHDLRPLLHNMEAYAKEGYWPQNDTACDKYGGCRFRGVCSRSPSVRQAFLDSDFRREPWNPLDTR